MQAGEFSLWGETYMTLLGSTDPDEIALVGRALTRRRIPYAVDPGVTPALQRVHIPSERYAALDPGFWSEIHGPREPVADPFSLRTMVREIHSTARRSVKNVGRVARRAAPRVSRRSTRR
jgi:hypothetical protein